MQPLIQFSNIGYRLFFTALILCTCLSTTAHAALTCGVYKKNNSSIDLTIRVLSENVLQGNGSIAYPTLMYYTIQGNKIKQFNLDMASHDDLKIDNDGKTILDMGSAYKLSKKEQCLPPMALPTDQVWKTCFQNPSSFDCITAKNSLTVADAKALCEKGIYFICKILPNAHRKQAGIEIDVFDNKKPLPAEGLKDMQAACLKGISAEACRASAEELWLAEQFITAKTMLEHACAAPINSVLACKQAKDLAPLTPAILAQSSSSKTLPTGSYSASTGILTKLTFEGNMAKDSDNIAMPAHIKDGIIYLAHNKGGNFEFKSFANDQYLIGLDMWNKLVVLTRDPK